MHHDNPTTPSSPPAPTIPPATPPALLFDPPKERIPEILDHLDSPFASLQNVANANNTTVEALALWMQRPEVQERNALIDSVAAQRTRSLATRNLRRAVAALSHILERAIEEDADPAFSNHPKARLARTKGRDLICRAARLLMQIRSLPIGVGSAEKPTTPTTPTRANNPRPPHQPNLKLPAPILSLHDLRARAGVCPNGNGRHNGQSSGKPRPT